MPTIPDTQHTNRLAGESSPYLLQHAHNPVDWYPWGPEAFEAARHQHKPIFLSVGYSTCYWCHVMERQCFENPEIAQEMNRRFINIKVDREERPDVDQLYMTAVQALTGQGGWPMSVFLTADLRAFYAGTYFPPVDSYGRPGFPAILRAVEDAFINRPEQVEDAARQVMDILQQANQPRRLPAALTIDWAYIDRLIEQLLCDYDPRHGGFSPAPKFPRQTMLELLLVYLDRRPDEGDHGEHAKRRKRILDSLCHTLNAMADGGIRDQLGGAFHRYSTDERWLVPHFEIMLYDNAMLAWVYTEAFRQTGDARYADVAGGILDFVLREMTSPQGAFYTAWDAEVDAQEGLSYLWTAPEIDSLLGEADARLFKQVYGVDGGPNFADPHHGDGRPDKSILYLPRPLAEAAKLVGLTVPQLQQRLEPMRQELYQVRRQRKQPLLDTKVITSWNGLMIRAMAFAGRVLKCERYTRASKAAADVILATHRTPTGGLWRSCRDGVARQEGFLDDYSFMIQALLELGQDDPVAYQPAAAELGLKMVAEFGDSDGGGFYFTAKSARDLIVRQKLASDSPLPSGNAVAAMVLGDLSRWDLTEQVIHDFSAQFEWGLQASCALATAAIGYLSRHGPIVVPAAPEDASMPSAADLAEQVVEVDAAWIDSTELHLHLGILRGYHLAPHDAPQGALPTTLVILGPAADQVADIEYPIGDAEKPAPDQPPQRIYRGAATIAIRFKQPMTNQPELSMKLIYQPCDDRSCLEPVHRPITVDCP